MASSEGRFVAIDLGASAGRVYAGLLSQGRVRMEELNRFDNQPVDEGGALRWDVSALFDQVKVGLSEYVGRYGPEVDGIGVDSWGVDFGLVDSDGNLLGKPVHYRDGRTEGMMEAVFGRIGAEKIYQITGIQFLRFNTIYQLMALVQAKAPELKAAARLLFVPDLFNFFLTGQQVSEVTIASTSQMLDAKKGGWSRPILKALGLRKQMMPALVDPGTVIGPLRSEVAEQVGLLRADVIAPACHDTGSAVAAVPAEPASNWAYISSGTWSLMGLELSEPLINEQTLAGNFTNEAGVAGTYRFLRNIAGLWLLQQCRAVWQGQGQELGYEQLRDAAERAEPFRSLVFPDDQRFLDPPDMVAAIGDFCRQTDQPVPETPGELVRCIYESLALTYRRTLDQLQHLTNHAVDVLHVVGGGARDELLCQFTAGACGLPVTAGPGEATALGNVLVQALATGRIGSLEELRAVSRRSCRPRQYEPRRTMLWQEQLERFDRLAEAGSS